METSRRGISLLDLFNLPPGTQALLPDHIAAQLEALAVLDHRATVSRGTFIHHGMLQSIGEGLALPGLRDWRVEIPGINTGIPFQLIFNRLERAAPPAPGEVLEPAPETFQLDLFLDRFAVRIPGLSPALVQETPGGPTHLVRDQTRSEVKLVGGAIFRLKSTPEGISAQFVDPPDPLDPDMPTGFIAMLTCDPPSFFFGGSEWGMTADRVLYDGSEDFTPPSIMERGHGSDWMGLSIKEATVYFPPSIGHLSIGVRDLLLGNPFGLQLEVRVEFGYLNLETFSVQFMPEGSTTNLPVSGTGQVRTVQIDEDSLLVKAQASRDFLPPGDPRTPSGLWTLPEHPEESIDTSIMALGIGLETLPFLVKPGDVVRFQAQALESGEIAAQFPELIFRFERAGGGDGAGAAPQHAPQVNVSANSHSFDNAVHLIGTAAQMNGVQFTAAVPEGEGSSLEWKTTDGRTLGTGRQLSGSLLPTTPGEHFLNLRDPGSNRTRRVLVKVLENSGEMLIGTSSGVFNSQNVRSDIESVRSVFDLGVFHLTGALRTLDALRPAVSAGSVTIPEGQLALVSLPAAETDPPVQPLPPPQRLTYGTDASMVYGEANFEAGQVAALESYLREYQDKPDVNVIVVGRTDDLWGAIKDLNKRRERNATLAVDRARAARREVIRILGGEPAAGSRVFGRGEQASSWIDSGPPPSQVLDQFEAGDREHVTADRWKIEHENAQFVASPPNKFPETSPRPSYRIVEVWAVRTASDPPPSNGAGDPPVSSTSHIDVLLPGPDRTEAPVERPRERAQSDPRGWRFRLIVKWDSPTLVSLSDAVPTLAEILIEWEGDRLNLPAGGTPPVEVTFSRREVFAITGRWAYDPRSGETLFSIRVESRNDPDGLFPTIDLPVLAAAFGFAPALLAAVNPPYPGSTFVAISALFVVAGFLTSTIPPMSQPIIPDGKLAIRAIQAEQRLFAGEVVEESRTRVTLDYSVELGFAIESAFIGISTDPEKPIRIKYKNVGFEVKWRREGGVLDFNGVFEDVSFEIEDPGQWQISGPMGNLLRVTGTRAGAGSSWFEFDLAFSIDLGVVSLTNAIVRLIFPAGGGLPEVELRGLGVGVNIPGVLEGAGRLMFGTGGDVRGAIEARIIPAKLQVVGAMRIQQVTGEEYTFVFLQIGVLFPVGLPLAQSGLAIFGLVGRFVSNGIRALPAEEDPIEREIRWHALAPENKYGPSRGSWAIGLGAAIGSLPDVGFSFNALGMFTVSFPEISVVFGIDAKFMSPPSLAAEQKPGGAGGLSLKLLGIVAIDAQSVKIGIRGQYEIPEVLKLNIPISAYFPINKTSALPFDAYVRIGSDGFRPPNTSLGHPRLGDTVTIQFLPSTLNVKVWSFLMFEEKRLYALGGDDRFDFTGFSIGFGAGFDIQWGGGPVRLAASAKILIGVGTKPMTMVGGIFVRGELWLVIVGITVTGELLLKLSEREQRVTGEFCGKVSFFFFSVKGCVKFELGTDPDLEIPFPGLLVPRMDLTDRRGVITGKMDAPPGMPPPSNIPSQVPVVWPDTIPVLSFQHHLKSAMDAETNIKRSGQPPTAPLWTGTNELKYTFRLTGVELRQQVGSTFEKLDPIIPAAWWWPTHRPGLLSPTDGTENGSAPPSEHEGRHLALLTWAPAAWAYSLDEGGAGTPGDPAETVDRICDPASPLEVVCVRGRKARRLDQDRVRLRPAGRGSPPYFDYFEVIGREMLGTLDLETAAVLMDELGLYLVRGRPITMTNPIAEGGAYELTAVYRFLRFFSTTVFRAQFSTTILEPVLLLALDKRRMEGGDRECIEFQEMEQGEHPNPFGHDLAEFTVNDHTGAPMEKTSISSAGSVTGLYLGRSTRVSLAQAASTVEFTLAHFNVPSSANAFDSTGKLVSSAEMTPGIPGDTPETLVLEGPGIVMVVIDAPGMETWMLSFCASMEFQRDKFDDLPNFYPAGLLEGQYDDLFNRETSGSLPPVTGILPNRSEQSWNGTIIAEDETHIYVEYVPLGSRNQPWWGFRIEAWRQHKVAIVKACGNTEQARRQQEAEQENRNDLRDEINGLVAATDPLANRYLLERNQLYQVRVRWQWAGWRKTEDEDAPPNPESAEFASRWQPEITQFFYFRTASETPPPTLPPPADLLDERTFDPRGSLRYFLGFEVAAQPDTHLLDDPIKAHFSVKHLGPLMLKYGYELDLQIRRTDMPPGTRVPETVMTPLEAPFTLAWHTLDRGLMSAVERRLALAVESEPCLDGYPSDGATGEIEAELLPKAEYDLLLLAKKTGSELFIARTHFYTSRYANANEILSALGFPTGGTPGFKDPLDLVISAGLPTDSIAGDDVALDQALHTAGLDPFPLAEGPRTSLLWQNIAGVWSLAGVLIESDEPLRRFAPRLLNDPRPPQERLSVLDVQLRDGSATLAAFTPKRSNATFTRVLLCPPTPPEADDLAGRAELALALRLRDKSAVVTGLRALAGAPIHMAEVI